MNKVNEAAMVVVGTADAVGDTAHKVVGTGAGVIIEILGGEGNGRTCPSVDNIQHKKWMEKLDPNLKLADLILPGVHHHGLVEGRCHHGAPFLGSKVMDWAVTQSLGIRDQLDMGARFLDIRLTQFNGTIYTAHGTEEKLVTLG